MMKNKKGEFLLSIITIIVMLVLFFMLYAGPAAIVVAMLPIAPDSTMRFILQLLVPAMLLGAIQYVFLLGRSGQ